MSDDYVTALGIDVFVTVNSIDYQTGIDFLLEQINDHLGALYTSNFEYPGRYTCWDIGFVNPPLKLSSRGNTVSLLALNQRGEAIIEMLTPQLKEIEGVAHQQISRQQTQLTVRAFGKGFSEEVRSKQPSVFSVIRQLVACFYHKQEPQLGLYGAFAYDLIYQFEAIEPHHQRDESMSDLILYLPDEIYVVDHRSQLAYQRLYDFTKGNISTKPWPRAKVKSKQTKAQSPSAIATNGICSDHQVGEYAETVVKAKQRFAQGDLFEVVPSQTFQVTTKEKPSELFIKLRKTNPAPYGFLINLGDEHLIGASPEMYVRVTERRVETCPISGTIVRGNNAIEDARQIESLLSSDKERAELTMCTDVDRNDKSRVCQAGSVKVIGRRQIEIYSRLIHTVDHVEGILADGYDAVDAFLSHMWVVTVTGAPKLWAMQFIEHNEKSPRRWYGGAVGWFGFNGALNTGLTLRTIRYSQGMAEVRVGATVLYDSDPKAEEQETRLKAAALLDILQNKSSKAQTRTTTANQQGLGRRVFVIDHDDSFVHTLASYFKQTGAEVITYRHGFKWSCLDNFKPDLVVLSPGPGSPTDFNLKQIIAELKQRALPIFGVCLGLQALVEYFGGTLKQLAEPVHGKPSLVKVVGGELFQSLPEKFTVGRYHSLYAAIETMPAQLVVSSLSEDGIVMSVESKEDRIYAVQFHPETILSLEDNIGYRIIERVLQLTRNVNEAASRH